MKLCCTCHENKPLTEFNKRASSRDGLQARCRSCSRIWYEVNKQEHKARVRVRNEAERIANREQVKQYLSTHPCVDCGTTDLRVLEFDHREGAVKVAEVGRLVASSMSWETIAREIDKCDVRCSNCHRIVTCERASNWRQRAFIESPDRVLNLEWAASASNRDNAN